MTTIRHEDIRWRVGSTYEKGEALYGILLGYIDARTAMDQLDALDPEWSDEYTPVAIIDGAERREGIQCALTVKGITRTDVGVPSNTDGLKGAYSDALKRAAVKHGIARELYDLPTIAVECEFTVWQGKKKAKKPKAIPTFADGRWTLPANLGWVRYDHEPTDTPPAARAAATRPTPAAVPPQAPPPADAPGSGGDYEESPFDETVVDPLSGEAVAAATGGEALPEKPPYVVKAEQKAAAQAASPLQAACPEHGSAKVKANKRGLYCATKMPDGTWCPWSQAAAA